MTTRHPLSSACWRAFLVGLSLILLGGLAAAPLGAAEKTPPSRPEQIHLSFAPVVRQAAPAVVNIYTRRVVRRSDRSPFMGDPRLRRFFGEFFKFGLPRERVQNSLGSGVLVSKDGFIVTSSHVIKGADEVTAVLSDRREFAAEIMRVDEQTDLAVLRIDTDGNELPYLDLRDSDELEVGDLVLAIGNPFGVGQTVTSGIVSALARTAVDVSDYRFFIQTDAAINPGNSGGALVSTDGRLVGINTAIFSKSGGSIGIGFAIPSNMVATVIDGVKAGGRIVRPWFGATGQAVTAEIARALGLSRPRGVILGDLYPNGPAQRAGLRAGDVVISVDGHAVDDYEALRFRIATLAAGGTVDLKVLREGAEQTLPFDLTPPPEDPPRETTRLTGAHPLAGATVVNLSPAISEELGFSMFLRGVVVIAFDDISPARRFGFRGGDIILAVNGVDVTSVRELKRILERRPERWLIRLRRGDRVLNMRVRA
jgi:serine protease Do